MEIEELPDLKVNWIESYKYLAEPLLEYVWEVANHFLPDYEDVSAAPAIFDNSCLLYTSPRPRDS